MSIARSDWPHLLTLVEQALDVPAPQREAWVHQLDLPAALRAALRRLLEDRHAIETDDFLDGLPRLAAIRPPGRLIEGTLIGPWRMLRELGQGGMSVVWLAERADDQLKRQVALKLPHAGPGQDMLAERLLRERNILAGLEHPHIARLYDVGLTDAGTPFLVMEFVEGESLLVHADRKRLTIPQRLVLFQQVLRAVQHAHGKLVLHRDLKPNNILVNAVGEVKLLDFGIAKALVAGGDTCDETELTRSAGRLLTPSYASPEQVRGEPLGTASDVYSLGVVLYELLCAHRPYGLGSASAARLEEAVLTEQAKAPSRRSPDEGTLQARAVSAGALRKMLAGDLDAIVLMALAKEPEHRYATAEAMRADVAHYLAKEPVSARMPGTLYLLRKFVDRNRMGVGLSTAAMAMVLVAAGVAVAQGLAAQREAARATASRDFMLQLFEDTDPDRAAGEELTAHQLLTRGREKAQSRLGAQPRLFAELLSGIGQAQLAINHATEADATLAEAAKAYESLGDVRNQASVLVSRMDIALTLRRLDDAKRLLGEVDRVLPAAKRDDDIERRLIKMRGFLAMHSGDNEAARLDFERLLGMPQRGDAGQSRDELEVRLALANIDMAAGRPNEANAQFLAATALVSRGGVFSATDAATVSLYRANAENGSGRYADVVSWLPMELRACDRNIGSRSDICWRLRGHLDRAWLKMGWVDSALALVPDLAVMIEQEKSPARKAEAVVLVARTLAAAGRLAEAPTLVAKLEAKARSGAGGDGDWLYRLIAMNTLAEIHLLGGRPSLALDWVKQAQSMATQAALPAGREGLKTKLFLGLALQALGDHAGALAAMQHLCGEARSMAGPFAVIDALFSLNCARSLAATGQPAAAVALVRRALPVLERGLGPDAPNLRRARQLVTELEAAGSAAPTSAAGSILFSQWGTRPVFRVSSVTYREFNS